MLDRAQADVETVRSDLQAFAAPSPGHRGRIARPLAIAVGGAATPVLRQMRAVPGCSAFSSDAFDSNTLTTPRLG